jgi:hypothetical protein
MRTRRHGVEGCLAQEDAPVETWPDMSQELPAVTPGHQLLSCDVITTFSNTSSCKTRLAMDCPEGDQWKPKNRMREDLS